MDLRNRTALVALALILAAAPALAQKRYSPGASDTEIKIGTTTPYSGPASAYSAGAVSITAYFTMINEQGGVNGRKLNFITPLVVERLPARASPDCSGRSARPPAFM